MRKKLLLISAVLTLSGINIGFASDDVYVDLSVLDNLSQDSIGFVATQPLFPEIKKVDKIAPKSKTKKIKKKKIEKKSPQTIKNNKVEVIKQQPENKPKIKVSPNIQVDVTDKPNSSLENFIDSIPSENISDDKKIIEQIPESNDIDKQAKEISVSTPAVEVQSTSIPDISKTDTVSIEPEAKKIIPSIEEKSPNTTAELLIPKPLISAKSSDVEDVSAPVIAPKEIYSISFAANSSDLSGDAKSRLEQALKTFDVNRKNKISIKAYNYDNGTDSFLKKRVSLTRATEVRSFFLNQGFKNFSIKVINTTLNDEKKDTVEVEELN